MQAARHPKPQAQRKRCSGQCVCDPPPRVFRGRGERGGEDGRAGGALLGTISAEASPPRAASSLPPGGKVQTVLSALVYVVQPLWGQGRGATWRAECGPVGRARWGDTGTAVPGHGEESTGTHSRCSVSSALGGDGGSPALLALTHKAPQAVPVRRPVFGSWLYHMTAVCLQVDDLLSLNLSVLILEMGITSPPLRCDEDSAA